MTAASHVPIALNCHAASGCEAVRALRVAVRVFDDRLMLRYVLDADLSHLRLPEEHAPQRAHELWTHTCFEAFLGEAGSPGYCELNFAPSRSWAMYRFSARREGMAVVTEARAPEIVVQRSATGLTLEAIVFLHDLIPSRAPLVLRTGLAAVLEDEDGRLSYWAARHPPGKPDFHHPDHFTLELRL
jgi:hypothetical protein